MKISLFTYTRCAANGTERISQSIILYRFPTPFCSAFSFVSRSRDETKHTSHRIDPLRASRGRQTRASASSISIFFRSFFRFGWVPPSWIHPVPLRARTSANHEYARIAASRTYRFRDTPCAPSSFVVNQLCSFVERVRLKLKPSKIGFSEFCL
jgi:hypothetical protein